MGLTKEEEVELVLLLEAQLRSEARKYFYKFCQYMDEEFFTPGKWHLKEIAQDLQDLHENKITKLAISLPPRAGKSYIISLFCAWEIGLDEGRDSIMRNSYGADLAEKFSYDIRDIIQMPKFLELFPKVKLKYDKKALQGWSTTKAKDFTYFCAGVGGPVTGKGAKKLAILDDPVKNIEDALSPVVLDNTWNWYTSTHMSRLEVGCKEIQIGTRWSKKDVIGRLTDPESEFFSPDYKCVVISAMVDGHSFCEEIKTTEEYLEIKRVTEPFIWEAEYMQNPIEVKGLLLPIQELKRFSMSELNQKPDGIIGATDTADQGNNYLCSLVATRVGDYSYITDVYFTQEGVEVTTPELARMIIDSKCQIMKIESNAQGKIFGDNVRKIIKQEGCFCRVISEVTSGDKGTRVFMAAGYIKEYFYFRNDYKPGSHYDHFMRQLTSYVRLGKNSFDDAADCCSLLAQYMEKSFKRSEQKPIDERIKFKGKYLRSELEMKGFKSYEIKKMERDKVIEVIGE